MNGSLDRDEIREFIDNICQQTGVQRNPDDKTLEAVFADMDSDGSNDVSFEELEDFVRRIFILQRDEISQVVKLNQEVWSLYAGISL